MTVNHPRVALILLIAGCTSCISLPPPIGTERVVDQSSSGKPGWILRIPDDTHADMFFRGVASLASSEREALDDARSNAVEQVLQMIETKGRVDYTRVRVEKGSPEEGVSSRIIQDGLKLLSQNATNGVKEVESYWEKVEKVTGERQVSYHFNAFMLVRLPKAGYSAAMQESIQELKQTAQKEVDADALDFLKKLEEEFQKQ